MLILDRQFGRSSEIFGAFVQNYAKVMQHVQQDVEISNFLLRVPKF